MQSSAWIATRNPIHLTGPALHLWYHACFGNEYACHVKPYRAAWLLKEPAAGIRSRRCNQCRSWNATWHHAGADLILATQSTLPVAPSHLQVLESERRCLHGSTRPAPGQELTTSRCPHALSPPRPLPLLTSLGNGIALPLFSLLFGDFIQAFGSYIPPCSSFAAAIPGLLSDAEFRRLISNIALKVGCACLGESRCVSPRLHAWATSVFFWLSGCARLLAWRA